MFLVSFPINPSIVLFFALLTPVEVLVLQNDGEFYDPASPKDLFFYKRDRPEGNVSSIEYSCDKFVTEFVSNISFQRKMINVWFFHKVKINIISNNWYKIQIVRFGNHFRVTVFQTFAFHWATFATRTTTVPTAMMKTSICAQLVNFIYKRFLLF